MRWRGDFIGCEGLKLIGRYGNCLVRDVTQRHVRYQHDGLVCQQRDVPGLAPRVQAKNRPLEHGTRNIIADHLVDFHPFVGVGNTDTLSLRSRAAAKTNRQQQKSKSSHEAFSENACAKSNAYCRRRQIVTFPLRR
jgi:hypothetical protein